MMSIVVLNLNEFEVLVSCLGHRRGALQGLECRTVRSNPQFLDGRVVHSTPNGSGFQRFVHLVQRRLGTSHKGVDEIWMGWDGLVVHTEATRHQSFTEGSVHQCSSVSDCL